MRTQEWTEDKYVKRVYRRIITLALAAHTSYVVIFILLGLPLLAVYNVCSVLFYIVMQIAVGRGCYRLAVSCIHLEVCVFASVCTLGAGWGLGIALYLMALTSLTYFCPFRHKYVPYLFSALEVFVFLALKLYTGLVRPDDLAVSKSTGLWLYVYSVCACFTIILYAAFSSNVSAAVSRQELQDENRSLTVLANYDQLTGLLSRHAFLTRLEKSRGTTTTLALGDIDDFKAINDIHGHSCGDQVLSETADLVRCQLGGEVEVCRWGGEEFVFLFRDLPLEEVLSRVQALCDAIAGHTFYCGGSGLHVTMTFGVSPDVGEISMEELVELADREMYRGKAGGKNRVVCAYGNV